VSAEPSQKTPRGRLGWHNYVWYGVHVDVVVLYL